MDGCGDGEGITGLLSDHRYYYVRYRTQDDKKFTITLTLQEALFAAFHGWARPRHSLSLCVGVTS